MYQFAFPPTEHKGSLCSTCSPTLVISCLFDNSLSDRCAGTAQCGFDLHPLMTSYCAPSMYLLVIFILSLENCPSLVELFGFLPLSCMSLILITHRCHIYEFVCSLQCICSPKVNTRGCHKHAQSSEKV